MNLPSSNKMIIGLARGENYRSPNVSPDVWFILQLNISKESVANLELLETFFRKREIEKFLCRRIMESLMNCYVLIFDK